MYHGIPHFFIKVYGKSKVASVASVASVACVSSPCLPWSKHHVRWAGWAMVISSYNIHIYPYIYCLYVIYIHIYGYIYMTYICIYNQHVYIYIYIVCMIPCHGYSSKLQFDRAPEARWRPEHQSPRPRCESWVPWVEIREWNHSMDWFKGKSTGNHGFYHQI